VVVEGISVARRVGQTGMYNWLVGTSAVYQLSLGTEWDAPLVLVEETVAGNGSPYDRARAGAILAIYRAYRGVDIEKVVEEAQAAVGDIRDPQLDAFVDVVRSVVGLLTGCFDEAFASALRSYEKWSDFGHFMIPLAVRAALYDGSLEKVREAGRRWDGYPGTGALPRAGRMAAAGAVALLEDRPQEALSSYRASIEHLKLIGADFRAAETALDAVTGLPDEPSVRAWAAEGRTVFERVGAKPYLQMLEQALAGVPSAPLQAAEASSEQAVSSV
jgi:hypothetical protein